MAITYVSYNYFTDSGGTPITAIFDIGTRTNGLLIVAFMIANTTDDCITEVRWDGDLMSQAVDDFEYRNNQHMFCYYLPNPSDGNKTLSIAFTGTNIITFIGAVWADGVLQASPLDQAVTALDVGPNISVDITPTTNNQLVFAYTNSEADDSPVIVAGETQIFSELEGDTRGNAASYDIQTTAELQTMDFSTIGTNQDWGILSVSFKEVAVAAEEKVPELFIPSGRQVLMPRSRL